MNSHTITVHWHDENQPVYLVDFQPGTRDFLRLATAGGDNNVRMWQVGAATNTTPASVSYLLTLRKHTQAINVVRFDPRGDILALAGDDGLLILWNLLEHVVKEFGAEEEDSESWVAKHVFRSSTSEIYDLSWLPDLRYIATGSMDNVTRIYCVSSGHQVAQLAEHNHYVQGVAWDPRNEFLATQAADRAVHVYLLKKGAEMAVPTTFFKITRAEVPVARLSERPEVVRIDSIATMSSQASGSDISTPGTPMNPPTNNFVHPLTSSPSQNKLLSVETLPAVKPMTSPVSKKMSRNAYLYHSETLQSFFRRLAFSPDGSLLLTPLGVYRNDLDSGNEQDAELTNTVYIYIRSGLNKAPVCHIPGLKKPAIAIAFSPVIYEAQSSSPVFKLPYKMLFAVATQDSIIIYDTEAVQPLGVVSNLHYLTITDLCWSQNGQSIIVSSADGFCSIVVFDEAVFGKVYCTRHEINKVRDDMIDAKILEAASAEQPKPTEIPGTTTPQPKKRTLIDLFILSEKKPDSASRGPEAASLGPEIDRKERSTDNIESPAALLKQFTAPVVVDLTDGESPSKVDLTKKKRRVMPTLVTESGK